MKRFLLRVLLGLFISLGIYSFSYGQQFAYSWLNQLEGSSQIEVLDIEEEASYVYVLGKFYGTVDFKASYTPGALTASTASGSLFFGLFFKDGGSAYYVRKIEGTTGTPTIYGTDLELAGSYVYVSGYFDGTVDFDPSPTTRTYTTYGSYDGFIGKYARYTGNWVWAQRIGGTSFDYVHGIAIDASDNVYAVGNFYGTCDFDPSGAIVNRVSNGSADLFMARYTSLGAFSWAVNYGDASYQSARDVEIDGSYMYVTGYGAGSISMVNNALGYTTVDSYGGYDPFFAKIGLATPFCYMLKNFGGTGNEYAFDMALDASGNIFIT
ncbi:MAG: hypothetical protein OEY51_10210, partial [Cyclobacteriaceae bacterium]|nr:hypothetical protein [Cyclobacteriaceae bacterium]